MKDASAQRGILRVTSVTLVLDGTLLATRRAQRSLFTPRHNWVPRFTHSARVLRRAASHERGLTSTEGRMAEFLDDYEPLTAAMQMCVGRSDMQGRCLVAKEDLAPSEEILEEVPLISWPTPAAAATNNASAGRTLVFCDACLCVFARAATVACCSKGTCSLRFCSQACSEGHLHESLCGSLAALRAWQGSTAIDSQYGVEAIARCNVRIAMDTVSFVAQHELEPALALLNASRPWERLCAFPSGFELSLGGGASAEDLAAVLRMHTFDGLTALLATRLANEAAQEIACQLTSIPHVTGLLERLLLNTFQWRHPSDGSLAFGGVFLLMCNANHNCTPNIAVVPTWTRLATPTAHATLSVGAHDSAPASSATSVPTTTTGATASELPAVDPTAFEASAEPSGPCVRDSCSIILRTTERIAKGAELLLSYVDVGKCAPHWGHASLSAQHAATHRATAHRGDGASLSLWRPSRHLPSHIMRQVDSSTMQ